MNIIYQLFLVLLLSFCAYNCADPVMKSNMLCLEVEREALLAFKHGITYDDGGILSSWKGEDCCRWEGVECSNHSDSKGLHHVIGVNLFLSDLEGEISPRLGNLSSLRYLDLSYNSELKVTDPRWLESLTSLVALNFSLVQLQHTGEGLFESINKLPSLVELRLFLCGLSELPYSLPHINFTSLALLDLSFNNFNSLLPPWFFNLTGLETLNLAVNPFGGFISDWDFSNFKVLQFLSLDSIGVGGQLSRNLGSLCKLKTLVLCSNRLSGTMNEFFQGFSNCSNGNSLRKLYLSYNRLEGKIPASIEIFKHLQVLSLSNNKLCGLIPQSSIGQLQELKSLFLAKNHYEGFITELLFLNLERLESFSIESNKVIFNMTFDWMPPFRLTYLYIINCHVGPKIPKWIRVQSNLTTLVLRNVSISGILSVDWIHKIPLLYQLDLSHNDISGRIHSWIYTLGFLQLNNNQLSGSLPECFNESSNILQFLDLSNNNLSGMLPSSMFLSTSLEVLSLSNNRLQGVLPVSLQNASLVRLDVGGNMLCGTLPTRAPASWVLRLRSNSFHGPIPEKWCDNPSLHILDLADNNLYGPIPNCMDNITELWSESNINKDGGDFIEEINEITKGTEQKYTTIAPLLNIIDLSRNNLSDKIPVGLMNLTRLGTLNLSMNHLTGKIPKNIGNMRSLETLDLSNNNLSGEIPQSISSISFLNHLNLSFNQLEGKIPSGIQLETLNDDVSIYEGNPLLCGHPLQKKCHPDTGDSLGGVNNTTGEEETKVDGENLLWIFVSMAAGYVVCVLFCGLVYHLERLFLDFLDCISLYS